MKLVNFGPASKLLAAHQLLISGPIDIRRGTVPPRAIPYHRKCFLASLLDLFSNHLQKFILGHHPPVHNVVVRSKVFDAKGTGQGAENGRVWK